jgi:polysaccharide biosynthesis protein PslH
MVREKQKAFHLRWDVAEVGWPGRRLRATLHAVKILWVSPGFLHPTTRGGQIRTLEMLRQLHVRHEVHFVGLHDGNPEALARSSEFCAKADLVPFRLAKRASLRFWMQTALFSFSTLPVVVARKKSRAMRSVIEGLLSSERFDVVVCDFLTATVNLPPGTPHVLFAHNVESLIWQRYAENAPDPVRRSFFAIQAKRVLAFEQAACRKATHVVAVSEADAKWFRDRAAVQVSAVPTGVDANYFSRPSDFRNTNDSATLLFVGSMDWMPNIDGVLWFVEHVLPLIRRRIPECSLTIAGRRPAASIRRLAASDPLIRVTGTVDDIRPFLWESSVAIVPLRIGGGTRLKIYEAMAAEIPAVSTTIGAEGLDVSSPSNIRIADTAQVFAEACMELLCNRPEHARQTSAALDLVRQKFPWEVVAASFEEILQRASFTKKRAKQE